MKRLIALTCALSIVAHGWSLAAPASKDASAGGDTGDSSSTGSQPFTGKVTINGSAGKAEATLLAADAINRMSWQICEAVVDAPPGGDVVIVTGYSRPDVSEWLTFDNTRAHIAQQFNDLQADFKNLQGSYNKARAEANPPKTGEVQSRPGRGRGQGLIDSVIRVFTPPTLALTAISRLTTVIGAIAQSNYEAGSIDITLTDNVLANAVAGRLRSPTQKVSFVDQRSLVTASKDTIQELQQLHDTRRAFEAGPITAIPDMIAQLKKWEALPGQNVPDRNDPTRDKDSVAHLKQLEAALQELVDSEKIAAANLYALEQALYGAPSGGGDTKGKDATATAADAAGADAAAVAADPNAAKDPKATKATKKPDPSADAAGTPAPAAPKATPLATILKQRAVATALDKGQALYLKIESAGGGYYAKQNLWTFFGGMPFYVSAGSTVTFDLTDKDGDVLTSGSIVLGGDYIKASQVAGALSRDRGTETDEHGVARARCLQPWPLLRDPSPKKQKLK